MGRNGLPGKFPDDCSQFVFCMKTDAVINGPQSGGGLVGVTGFKQDMPSFSVGIVDEEIQQDNFL